MVFFVRELTLSTISFKKYFLAFENLKNEFLWGQFVKITQLLISVKLAIAFLI